MSAPLLSVHGLAMRFGGLLAVDDLSFDIAEGEILALIGPNGAGKTTVFNCLSGFYRPTAGRIVFDRRETQALPSHRLARRGIMRTFQNIRLFRQMTVLENLLVAQHAALETGLLAGLLRTRAWRDAEARALERACAWLDRVGLREHANRAAGTLAYGQQRRLEIARCMVTGPRLLLLDEPAAGLNPSETQELDALIQRLRAEHGVTVLLIEHDMALVMGISDRVLVMEYGRRIALGDPAAVRADPQVVRAYLGEA